jgi:hypothetical protein
MSTTESKPSKKYVVATYSVSTHFHVPEGIDLQDGNTSYFIKWDTMYITVKDNYGNVIKEVEVKWDWDPVETLECKWPSDVGEEEDK